ncbi:hypothetical protein [Prevotella sp. HUN102]|uniref:hypothetical protein n=1 Tax=Prevotella sp. HUN102 TaxID=1392486 RepID=UPI00048B6D3F|nr:hypothetical protein [Prevotella sp. HUN102]
MATEDIKTARTIVLSKETAALFDCKKNLDECFNKLGKVHDKIFCHNEQFDDKLSNAYVAINQLIMDLLTEQIDYNSTESHYKVI